MEHADRDLQEFEDWMYEKYSRSTIEDTSRKMRFFSKQCELFSREGIREFLICERRNGSSKQKVNEYIKYLNRWISFQSSLGKEGWDKFVYVHGTKKKYVVNRYDADQIRQLIERSKGTTVEDMRDHTMILLTVNTGLRRSEITNLQLKAIHADSLRVEKGKGEKTRDVYLDGTTKTVLSSWLKIRNHPDSEYVFTTKEGKVTSKYMGNLAARITKRTGIKFNWHKLRHTYAWNMLSNKVDLQTISQMLGHERLDTTAIYTVLDQQEAIEHIRDTNPKFFKEEKMFESPKSCTSFDGLAGI